MSLNHNTRERQFSSRSNGRSRGIYKFFFKKRIIQDLFSVIDGFVGELIISKENNIMTEKDLQTSRGILLLVFTLNVESFERLEELIYLYTYTCTVVLRTYSASKLLSSRCRKKLTLGAHQVLLTRSSFRMYFPIDIRKTKG